MNERSLNKFLEKSSQRNLVIIGASRAGKSTLSKMIAQEYDNYHILSGDSIRWAFNEVFPEMEINAFEGKGMNGEFQRFCASLFKNIAKRNQKDFHYILETCDLPISMAVELFNIKNTDIVCLGYPNLIPEEALENYRMFEELGDWTVDQTDDELLKHADKWIRKSRQYEQECYKYNIQFINTSYFRTIKLKYFVQNFNRFHQSDSSDSIFIRDDIFKMQLWDQYNYFNRISRLYNDKLPEDFNSNTYIIINVSSIHMKIWNMFLNSSNLNILYIHCIKRESTEKNIILKNMMPLNSMESHYPIIYLTDNSSDIIEENKDLFRYRNGICDIILDFKGNVVFPTTNKNEDKLGRIKK